MPAIPVIDARRGGPLTVARAAEPRMRDLFGHARRTYTPPVLAVMDVASRRWLDRVGNPYRGELDELQGWEHSRPATAELALDLSSAFQDLPASV